MGKIKVVSGPPGQSPKEIGEIDNTGLSTRLDQDGGRGDITGHGGLQLTKLLAELFGHGFMGCEFHLVAEGRGYAHCRIVRDTPGARLEFAYVSEFDPPDD